MKFGFKKIVIFQVNCGKKFMLVLIIPTKCTQKIQTDVASTKIAKPPKIEQHSPYREWIILKQCFKKEKIVQKGIAG